MKSQSHLRRLIVEQASQVLSVIATLADRVLLTAVLLRMWGATGFEAWSTCIAIVGLVSMFELGFNLYFNNRLMEEHEQGRLEDARHTLFIANTIFLSAAGLCIVASVILQRYVALPDVQGASLAVLAMCLAIALRIAVTAYYSLYRANRQYARLVLLQGTGECIRIIVAAAVCLAGGGLLEVALAATLFALVPQVIVPIVDGLTRFAPRRIGFAIPSREELTRIVGTSSAFFAQSVPNILLISLPVLYMSSLSLGTGALATFVLIRTLSGFPRALLLQFGVSLGQEATRRLAAGDPAGGLDVTQHSLRLYSAASGAIAGLLLAAGYDIVVLWTGNSRYFDALYLGIAVLPMIVAASSTMSLCVLMSTNVPKYAAIGRWVQLSLTGLLALVLPIDDTVLRCLLALSLGEILGFVPFAYLGLARLMPGLGARIHLYEMLITLCAMAAVFIAIRASRMELEPVENVARLALVAAGALICLVVIPVLGLRKQVRQALLEKLALSAGRGNARVQPASERKGTTDEPETISDRGR